MSTGVDSEFSKMMETKDEYSAVNRIFVQLPPKLTKEEKKRSALLTYKLHNALRKRTRPIGEFKYKVAVGSIHYECPINVVILDKSENIIASLGFYLLSRKGKTTLVINGIQGKRNMQEQLNALSKQVGENWRVWAVKRIKRVAKTSGITTSGSLPGLHALLQPSSPEEYKRQLRQYSQTFRKAEILEVLKHKVEPYPKQWKDAFQSWKESIKKAKQVRK